MTRLQPVLCHRNMCHDPKFGLFHRQEHETVPFGKCPLRPAHNYQLSRQTKRNRKMVFDICTDKKMISTISINRIRLPWPQHWCDNKVESHNCVGTQWNSGTMSPDHRSPSIQNSRECWCSRPDWSLMYLR